MMFKNKKGIKKDPSVIKGVIIILVLALVTAFVFNNLSPHGLPLFGQWQEKGHQIETHEK